MLDVIAFDADDTLWHSETLYYEAQSRFKELLAPYHPDEHILDELYETEVGNLGLYGYGIRSFELSMIETAVRISEGQVSAQKIHQLIQLAKTMLQAPVRLLEYVAEVIPALSESYNLMLITKGDLFDQQAKISRSGLGPHFEQIEVVATKTPDVYRALLDKHRIDPQRFLMVGDSLRSDILPVLALGAYAVRIPYPITWQHESMDVQPIEHMGYVELEHLGLLPEYVQRLGRKEPGLV